MMTTRLKTRWPFLLCAGVLAAGSFAQSQPSPAPAGKSLKDAFASAVKRSESVGIQQELLTQAAEGRTQAEGGFYPTISGSAVFLHQQLPQPQNLQVNTVSDQRTSKISLNQSLFRGLKDLATLRQQGAKLEAQSYAVKNAARTLFSDLAVAYYNVLSLQSDEQNYQKALDVNRQRLGELKHFIQVGRSRQTEMLTFQSNISSLEAQLESTHGQLESAKDVLAYLTGWSRDTVLKDNEGEDHGSELDITQYLAKLEDRPDVKAAIADKKAAKEGVPIARSGHLPSLDLVANNYFDRPGYPQGAQDWDASLVVTVPLFQGGVVSSQVRQAESAAAQAELVLSQTKRLAEQEIRTLYDAYSSDLKQIKKLQETADWSKKSADAQLKDYRHGLVTNLDVLQALTTSQDSQRALDRQKLAAKADAAKLQAAAMMRSEVEQIEEATARKED